MSFQTIGILILVVLGLGALLGMGFGRAKVVDGMEPNIENVPRKRLRKMLKEWAHNKEVSREAYWKPFRHHRRKHNN